MSNEVFRYLKPGPAVNERSVRDASTEVVKEEANKRKP